MPTPRRVVVTGMGAISALGRNREEFWSALIEGRSGISAIEGFEPGVLRFPNAAQVRGYDPTAYFDPKDADMLDRFAQFGMIAAREAVAGFKPPERTAIVTGCCVGGQETEDAQFQELYGKNTAREHLGRIHPLTIPRIMSNATASRISLELGVTGPVYNISTACSSSNHAIGNAFWMIRNGVADAALAGGSEAIFSLGFLKAWEAMRVVSPDTCRPFSKDRRGMILGEGGAMLLLESLDHALARRAPIHAEIAGFGMSSDAHHITQPQPEGAARAMRGALDDAGVTAEQVEYINAHGTGTSANDAAETSAIRDVFGVHADRLPVSSTKSMHGHALGAAGALEAVATVLALERGVLPPTANFTEPDPACNLDVIPNVARTKQVSCAMSNSFAFGGLNAVLLFRRFAGVLTLLALPALVAVPAHACSEPPAKLTAGYRSMYDLDFATAHRTFAEWKSAHPEDGMGSMSSAAAYLFAELERLHILESEFFTNDKEFTGKQRLRPDPAVKRAFDAEIAAARRLGGAGKDENSAMAVIFSAGLEADYLALIEKRYLRSLDEMKASRLQAETLLQAHPDCYDGYIAIGVEDYVLSLRAAPVRWLLRLGGSHTDQEEGIATLRKVADRGRLLQPFARLLLAVAALRAKDFPGAAQLLQGLAQEFPRNHLYASELAKLRRRKPL